jgi:hypothetical protein
VVETPLAISSTADPLILLPYDAGVITKGIGNRRVGNLQNQGLSPSILAYQKEIHL